MPSPLGNSASKTKLLTQLSATCAVILGIQAGFDTWGGYPQFASFEIIGMLFLGLSVFFTRKGNFLAAALLFFAVSQTVLLLFDDGFTGKASAWVLHLPLLAATFGLFEGREKRWRLLALCTPLSLAVVNFTTWAPHLNTLTAADQEPFVAFANLLIALLAVWLIQHFLEERYLGQLRERDQLERQLQSALQKESLNSQAKSKLISHVSHEFRTPLNAISGFAQLLRTEPLSPSEQSENLEAIHHSADHLVHLVNNLLDLSRLEHGELQLARTDFDPEAKIRECLSVLQPLAREKGLLLDASFDGASAPVTGDSVRLTQIILNLAGNAIKFTATGSVALHLRQDALQPGQCLLRLDVSDTGPGIPESQHEFIFGRFTRLDHAPTGTGLGLAICRELVEKMGGTLNLTSQLGVGTTFTAELPMELAPQSPKPIPTDSWTRRPLAHKRVLLCDDNRLNLRLGAQVLKRMAVAYELTESGEEVLQLAQGSRYDLIILDLHMPGIDGFAVATALRAGATPNRHTPLLALTADPSEATRDRCLKIGMTGFATKPIHLGELELQLRHMLEVDPI